MRRLRSRLTTLFGTTWAALATLFGLLLAIALTALILSGILWGKQGCNSPICQDCNSSCVNCNSSCIECIGTCTNTTGKIFTIITDNSTFEPNGTLVFTGTCGIESFIDEDGNISYTNKREVTKYIVGLDNCSQFATPQEAYNQAVLDGTALPGGAGAVILIKPGDYSFGDTEFPIIDVGITFYGLPGGRVIFSSNATTGGISITVPIDMVTSVVFTGITFGQEDSTNGFLLNITSGRVDIYECFCINSNFRMLLGADGETFLVVKQSELNTLPPNDFITAIGSNIEILFQNVNLFISQGSPGGHMITTPLGFNNITLSRCYFYLNYYDGIFKAPLTGGDPTLNLFNLRFSTITQSIFSLVDFDNYIINLNGPLKVEFEFNVFETQGFIIFQNTSSGASDQHYINFISNDVQTGNSTVFLDTDNIGLVNQYFFVNNYLNSANVGEFFNCPVADPGNTLQINLLTTTLRSTAGPGGIYAIGPGAGIATINIGNSLHFSQATVASGFTVINLVEL